MVRRRLLEAAAQVFAERGFADSRLDDIARVPGFTKGAVYSNFASKEELFAAILTERSDTEHAAVRAEIQEAEDAETAVSHVARTVARGVTGDTQRGRLGLEYAARATRDEETREVVASVRRAQRAAAGRFFAEVASGRQVRLTVDAELAGPLSMDSANGEQRGSGISSPRVETSAENGAINLAFSDAPDQVAATTQNGDISLEMPATAYAVTARSDSDNVDLAVPEDPESPHTITIRTDNGPISLRTAD